MKYKEITETPFTFSKKTLNTVLEAVKLGELNMETEIEDIKEILKYEFGVELPHNDVKRHLKCLTHQDRLNCDRVYGTLSFTIKQIKGYKMNIDKIKIDLRPDDQLTIEELFKRYYKLNKRELVEEIIFLKKFNKGS